MPRKDIEFTATDGTSLRGWLFTPSTSTSKLPCIIMSHGFGGVKEQDLPTFAEEFSSKLPVACLVYDNRCFGTSGGSPRQEIDPWRQFGDISDAVTFAQLQGEIDAERIGLWGSSYAGGSVLWVAAVDRRVKAVVSQVPLSSGWETARFLARPEIAAETFKAFQHDRQSRMQGNPPIVIPIVSADPVGVAALPGRDGWDFFQKCLEDGKSENWKNEVTLRSVEYIAANEAVAHIHRIAPTPLLMVVATHDAIASTQLALEAYGRAREPKQLHMFTGGHFDAYRGDVYVENVAVQVEFWRRWLCA